MYSKLFEKGYIGQLELKNRLVMTSMESNLADIDGTPSEDMIAYYEARAKGGAGLIITGITRVNDLHGPGTLCQLSVTKDRHIEPLSRLARAVQKHGTKLFIQLQHPGREGMAKLNEGGEVTAPSAIMCKLSRQPTRALENAEVKELIGQFIDGAVRVKKAGCDGVEIHAAHGYLVNQFLSPYTNKRDDEYGGSFENRMRFITEIINGIREKCGSDFPLIVRLSVDEFLNQTGVKEPYIDIQEGIKISKALEALKIDALDVSCGIYETGVTSIEPISFNQGWRRNLIKAIKDNISLPVIGVSVIREPQVAAAFIEDGIVDFVASGRSWLADEEWGKKMQEGRSNEIRKCISCMHCFGSLMANTLSGTPFECAVNPRLGRELKYGEPARDIDRHKVVVVGGGPAGMIAARTLALRGSDVTLYEKSSELGGAINIAKAPPLKDRMQWLTDFYCGEFGRLNIKTVFNKEITASDIENIAPDAVIIATGATPIIPESIPGTKGENVYSVDDILCGKANLSGKNIVLVGAGLTGLETAEHLGAAGNKVTIVDMLKRAAPGANPTNVGDVLGRLRKQGVKWMMEHKLKEITPEGVILTSIADETDVAVSADAVVLSLGNCPDNALYTELKEKGCSVYIAGNAVRDDVIAPATRAGFEIARSLFVKKDDAPSFIANIDELKSFCKTSVMADQEGVYIAFLSDPEVLSKLLPAPLKPHPMPVVLLSACYVKNPTFARSYYEAVLYIQARNGKDVGFYCISLLLGGEGAEMATQVGRDAGFAKKLGAQFEFKKHGNTVSMQVSRFGTQIVDAKVELGEYNNILTDKIFDYPKAGKRNPLRLFLNIYNRKTAHLVEGLCEFNYKAWKPGYASLTLGSSPDDPWGDIPVRKIIGGAYCVNDLALQSFNVCATVETRQVLSKLIFSRYDKSAFMQVYRDEIK